MTSRHPHCRYLKSPRVSSEGRVARVASRRGACCEAEDALVERHRLLPGQLVAKELSLEPLQLFRHAHGKSAGGESVTYTSVKEYRVDG